MQSGPGQTLLIVAYKPKPGKEEELLQLTREHVPLLRKEGLATDRPVIAAQAKDGTVVEAFEWAERVAWRRHPPTRSYKSFGSATPPPARS
jgi:hypothetical protein